MRLSNRGTPAGLASLRLHWKYLRSAYANAFTRGSTSSLSVERARLGIDKSLSGREWIQTFQCGTFSPLYSERGIPKMGYGISRTFGGLAVQSEDMKGPKLSSPLRVRFTEIVHPTLVGWQVVFQKEHFRSAGSEGLIPLQDCQ